MQNKYWVVLFLLLDIIIIYVLFLCSNELKNLQV